MISESNYMELLKGCANWNERIMRERMSRMPYVDAQTNTAQRAAGHLHQDPLTRRVVRGDNGAASYEYPAERWKRHRPDASTTFVDTLVKEKADLLAVQQPGGLGMVTCVQSAVAASVAAAVGLEPEGSDRFRTLASDTITSGSSTPKHPSSAVSSGGHKQHAQSNNATAAAAPLDYDELSDSADEPEEPDDDGDDYEEPGSRRRHRPPPPPQKTSKRGGNRRKQAAASSGQNTSSATSTPSTTYQPAQQTIPQHLQPLSQQHQKQRSLTPSSKAATPQPNLPVVTTVGGASVGPAPGAGGTDEKPFGCTTCGAKYKSRAGLNYHLAHVHAEQWQSEGGRHPAATVASLCAEPPQNYCDFCLGDKANNKRTNQPEMLVACHDCGRAGHPTCLNLTENMIVSTRKYGWQCIECKSCAICGTSDHDEVLLFCDDCDRGFHLYCLRPPLAAAPEGEWSCHLCQVEFGSRASLPATEKSVPEK